MAWAHGTVRDGDELLVSVIDRDAAPPAGRSGAVTVLRDLPDIDRASRGPAWAVSRARTYVGRRQVRRQHWSDAVDLAHIHYVNRFTDAWLGPQRPPRLVVSVHDLAPHVQRGPGWVDDRLLGRLYREADGLIVHHERLRIGLTERHGISLGRVHVVGHQVFPVDAAERTERPTSSRPTILFFGALRANKGLDQLLTAFERLPASLDAELVIAGRGDAPIEAQARNAAQDGRVRVEIGHASTVRKAELFRDAHLVVLPYTDFSSQSGVLHDAYGHGRPVVVTDVGALGDTVRDEGTGFVVAPSDPAALAEAIEKMLVDDTAWTAAAAAGRGIAAARAPEVVGAQLRTIYDTL